MVMSLFREYFLAKRWIDHGKADRSIWGPGILSSRLSNMPWKFGGKKNEIYGELWAFQSRFFPYVDKVLQAAKFFR